MRQPVTVRFRVCAIFIFSLCFAPNTFAQLIFNHTMTDPGLLPQEWIDNAKANLHIAYGHTSHGSQLISGMNALEAYPDFSDKYEWSDNGSVGLDLDDYGIPCTVSDLSYGDYTDPNGVAPWVTCTRDFLDDQANSHINVIMWSWCSISGHLAQFYVDQMEILVAEYPDVHFVFMTGHAQGQGEDVWENSVHYNNQLIRQHCIDNKRILFDFADIEAYDPDGSYFWDLDLEDNLDYDNGAGGGNWAEEWITANPTSELAKLTTGDGVSGYSGCTSCSHSDSPSDATLNCVLKGRAAWWMFATLANGEIFADGFETGDTSAWSAES